MQFPPAVAPTVALLALLSAATPPLSAVLEAERIPLPPAAAAATLERSPFERRLTLRLAPAAVAAVARRLEGASRICPGLQRGAGAVTLRCRSARVRADLELGHGPPTLALTRLAVLPWRPVEEGAPLVPFDLEGLGLGPCPGHTAEAEGECLLEAGDLAGARRRFEAALAGGPAPLAALRLGDLALRDDDPQAAIAHWRRARAEAPWGRLAQARLCELDPACLRSGEVDAVFDATEVAWPLRADMVIRGARLRALRGRLAEVVRTLAAESRPGLACERAQPWCRRVLLLALRRPGEDGGAALGAYLDLPDRTRGPLALDLARAAAEQSATAGAPLFGATLLAAVTALVPKDALGPHLLRTARLFLDGGDRPRADEIFRYARAHLGPAIHRDPQWAGIERALRPAPAAGEAAPTATEPDPDVARASAAIQASRLQRLSRGDRP